MDTAELSSPAAEAPPSGTSPTPQDKQARAEKPLNGLLAALVTIYGCLTALVVFAASRADGFYYDNVFVSQSQLNDASELSIEAHIGVLHDFDVLEQMQTLEFSGADPEVIEFLYGQLSAEAQASLERSGEIDEIYGEEAYAAASLERELATRSFDLAAQWSDRASMYEALATALAVGLAFAAWASLLERTNAVRWMFTILATLMLVVCLGFLGVHLVTREPIEEYATFSEYEDALASQELESTIAGERYTHPSGAFEFALPAGWELVEQDAASALVSDGESAAGAEFSAVETAYTEEQMQAYATDFVAGALEDYQIDVLEVQPEFTHAAVTFVSDGIANRADFFFEQQEMVIFVFFFATLSELSDEMVPLRDGMLDTFQGHPEVVQAATP